MSCFNPYKAFLVPRFDDLSKNRVYVKPSNVKALRFTEHGVKSIMTFAEIREGDLQAFEYIPCRKCVGCREDAAKAWTDRLMIEVQDHDESWFLTLTYDDDHLPMCHEPNELGILPDRPTLCKKDFQDFMKRLRKVQPEGVRLMYYASGEYGDHTLRPHYHAIVFGLHLLDLKVWKQKDGFTYFSSEFLERIWKNGFVAVAKVNRSTAAYTCRYVMKKVGQDLNRYFELGIEPEFQLMSRRPSIARNFYDRKVRSDPGSFYEQRIHYLTDPDGDPVSFNIPRYFDYLTEKENSDMLVSVKEKRKDIGKARQKLLEAHSSKPYEEILADQESVKIASNINFRNSSKGGKL